MLESAILGAASLLKWAGLGTLGGATVYGVSQLIVSGPVKTVQDVFKACGLCNTGKNGEAQTWRVKRVQKRENGTTMVLRFPYGKTLNDVIRKIDAINTALGVDVAINKEGSYLVMDIPKHPLPSYISYSDRILELTRGTWKAPIGLSNTEWILHDFNQFPHLLIAGLTGGGKTVLLKSLIATLYLSHTKDECEFIGVDMKPHSLGFRKFYGVWNTLAATPEEFLTVLQETNEDMEQRGAILANANCESVQEYEEVTGQKFKRRFIIVDEYGKSFGSDVEADIMSEMMQLTAIGRGLGVHVILCTQRPDAKVIDGKIRANVESIVCFRVSNSIQSRVVLDHDGAEALPKIPGRAIYQGADEVIVQVPHITNKRLARIMPQGSPQPPNKQYATSIHERTANPSNVVKIRDR